MTNTVCVTHSLKTYDLHTQHKLTEIHREQHRTQTFANNIDINTLKKGEIGACLAEKGHCGDTKESETRGAGITFPPRKARRVQDQDDKRLRTEVT